MKRHHATCLSLVLPLALAACQQQPDDGTIVASGHVEATEVTVSTKVGGIIKSLPFEEGDTLTSGQELARLETVDTELTNSWASSSLTFSGSSAPPSARTRRSSPG